MTPQEIEAFIPLVENGSGEDRDLNRRLALCFGWRCCGAGGDNAIVPQVAAAFINATDETRL